ncbi:acetylcholine receptor subunit alpha-like protein [Plakobranchus ocellatus]|uniref:Acetylcholine receptor subunit alpha-like protein n=1 Tax=Plakobranchus ocellatus TaxID=259542 RepID=A0AAV3YFY5_9GAST|nr:acetylcholine receptor subunit alpha-like protein [Plakobranchus ocellatus]
MNSWRIKAPMLTVFAIALIFTSGNIRMVQAATKADHYLLHDYLFGNGTYKREVRPVDNDSNSVYVYMTFNLLSLVDVNEKDQTLVTNALLEMTWSDQLLTWSPINFGNVTSILVHQEDIWLPDVQVGNSVVLQTQLGYKQLPVRLTNIGWIEWNPTTVTSTSCDIDVTYYPMDTQVVFLSFTSTLVFALPADAGEKMSMGITVLLAYAVYLTIVADHLPNTSVQTSILAVYLTTLLGITAIAIVLSAFILKLHHRSHGRRVGPRTVKATLLLKRITFNLSEEDKHLTSINSIGPEDTSLEKKGFPSYQMSPSPSYLSTVGKTTQIKRRENKESSNSTSGNNSLIGSISDQMQRGNRRQSKLEMSRPESCPPVYHKPMTWQEVAEALDWFMFLFFTFLTTFLTIVTMLVLAIGAEKKAPTLPPILT